MIAKTERAKRGQKKLVVQKKPANKVLKRKVVRVKEQTVEVPKHAPAKQMQQKRQSYIPDRAVDTALLEEIVSDESYFYPPVVNG